MKDANIVPHPPATSRIVADVADALHPARDAVPDACNANFHHRRDTTRSGVTLRSPRAARSKSQTETLRALSHLFRARQGFLGAYSALFVAVALLLTVGADTFNPLVVPDPGALVVAIAAEPMRRVSSVQCLPEGGVGLLVELRIALSLHHLQHLGCRIAALVHLLQQHAVDLAAFLGISLDEFDGDVGARCTVANDRHEGNAVAIRRVGILLVAEPVLEGVDECLDVRRQGAALLQRGALISAERHELEGNREPSLKPILRTKQCLDGVVEVEAARLELGADGIVYPVG